MLRRVLLSAAVVMSLVALLGAPALADHGQAHNGETGEISKSDGLVQDEVVTITGIGYAPGSTLTVVQCFIWPATGPADCELSNYGQYTGTVGDDGMASVDYSVNVVEGRCDHDTPCFIVVSDGIGPDANGVGFPITFAAPAEEPDEPAPEPEEEPATEPAEEEPAPEPEEEPEPEPEPEPEEEAEAVAVAETDDEAAAGADDDDDGGSSAGLIIVIVAIVAIAAGGGWYFMRTRNAAS